jgi:hypothetical protein
MMGQAVADNMIRAIRAPVRGRTVCLVCQQVVSEGSQHVRLRGSGYVHRSCATYAMRLRPVGVARLGTPRSYAAAERAERTRGPVLTGD